MKNSLEGFSHRVEQGEELVSLKIGKLKSSSLRYRKKYEEKGTKPKKSAGHYKTYQHIWNGQSQKEKRQWGRKKI